MILAHAGVPFAAGGYVGVDVFFVISGYLITRLLIAEVDRAHSVSLATFYARRIKRLLPQALMAVVVVVGASWLLLSPTRAKAVSEDVMAAGGYVINWHFAAQSVDYFATGSADRPLDHFWSLAVEEQYYLLWPLLLLVITRPWRFRPVAGHRALAAALLAITTASLLYAVHLVATSPSEAYFSTPARAWELGLGGLLALAPARSMPAVVASCAAWAGCAAIATAAFAFGPTTAMPGPVALLPTLGAAALVVAGGHRTTSLPTRALSLRPAQALGRMSYAWYVWHWPVLVFAADAFGPLSAWEGLAVMGASLVPTAITHRWVEEPIRHSSLHRRRPRLTLAAAPVAASLMVLLGLGLAAAVPSIPLSSARAAVGAARLSVDRSIQRSASALRPTPEAAEADRSRAYDDGCLVAKTGIASPDCVYGDPSSPHTVVLFGDSHAMQFFPALERIAGARHWRLVELTKSGCPPARVHLRDFILGRPYPECDAWRESAMRRIAQERPEMVVTAGSARYTVLQDDRRLDAEESHAALVSGSAEALAALSRVAGSVTVVHDVPRAPVDVPSCVADSLDDLVACAFSERTGREAGDPLSEGARALPGVRVIDPVDQFCMNGQCPAVIGNVLVYRQTGHITATYAATMTPWFARRLPAS